MLIALHTYARNLPLELSVTIQNSIHMLEGVIDITISPDQLLNKILELEEIIKSTYKLILNFLPELSFQEQQLITYALESISTALYNDSQFYLQFIQEMCPEDKDRLRPLFKKWLSDISNLFHLDQRYIY